MNVNLIRPNRLWKTMLNKFIKNKIIYTKPITSRLFRLKLFSVLEKLGEESTSDHTGILDHSIIGARHHRKQVVLMSFNVLTEVFFWA